MKQRILSTLFILCMSMSIMTDAHAWQGSPSPQENIPEAEFAVPCGEADVPTQQEAYEAMMALQEQDRYGEGAPWTDEINYTWKGGIQNGIAATGYGCVAFAYELSDAAFGSLPARMLPAGQFTFSDVKVGDILRVNNSAHTVIVIKVMDTGVVIAEGNFHENGSYTGKVHWGRPLSKAEVEEANYYITRYPKGYVPPDDPSANDPAASGTISGTDITWVLTGSGTLTISGSGDMPDFSFDQPWHDISDQILKIVIEDGVTRVGACAFQGSRALSAEISASVTEIGSSAFQDCSNLLSAVISEGVQTIGANSFRGCVRLKSIALPASLAGVGDGAFMDCTELVQAAFAPGGSRVEIEDNLFSRCYKLASVTLPAQINRIGAGMFTRCEALSAVVIPKGAESIGEQAFASCTHLKSVTIPDSVMEIRTAAFSASGVKDIYYGGSEEQWKGISKLGDSGAVLTQITIHYNSADPDPGPGHTHTWDGGIVTKPASCTASGIRTYTCSGCGSTRTEDISAQGHSYGAFSVTKPASCTEDGGQSAACTRCDDVLTEIIPAKGHHLVTNEDGEYECTNELDENGESALVVTASIGEGYLAVRLRDGHTAPYAYQDAAAAQPYLSEVIRAALESVDSLLHYTITTIRFTPPTQPAAGEYVYQVTIRSGGRAAASSLTTEPLRMVIPAGGAPGPEPSPEPFPTPVPDPEPDREDTYSVTVLESAGGRVTSSARNAAQGERVTVTVLPEGGYELTGLTVTDSRGREIPVRDLGNNRFRFTMPGARVEISAWFTVSDSGTPDPAGSSPEGEIPGNADISLNPLPVPFTDVLPSEWYYSSVEYVWQHNLMNGISGTQFAPRQTASRAMIWTILARMNQVHTGAAPGGTWYESAMLWAVEQGVTDGSSPLEDITREQFAVMLWRNAGSTGEGGSLDSFSDAASVSGYAARAMQWAVSRGILQGSGGRLNPQEPATRAEIAAMIMRYASGV